MIGIVYAKNDYHREDLIKHSLSEYGCVGVLGTEYDFIKEVDRMAKQNSWPDAFVLSNSLPWLSIKNIQRLPLEIKKDSRTLDAGVRCYEYLRKTHNNLKTPIIFCCFESEKISAVLEKRKIPQTNLEFISLENPTPQRINQVLKKVFT